MKAEEFLKPTEHTAIALKSRIAVITGGARGIGKAIALRLARAGADLILLARTMPQLEETAAEIRTMGRNVLALATDVSCYQDVQRAVARGLNHFGRIDILVNNAGIQSPIGPLWENDPGAWEHTISVNLLGTFYCTRAVLPAMISSHKGKIINLSGGGATSPRPNFSAYAASKAAIVRLTETLAEEVKSHNIQVNAIAPGPVNTRMLDEILAAGTAAGRELADAQKRHAGGGVPAELAAELVLFLSSDLSDHLTGKLISALHDDWRQWDASYMKEITNSPWYTLRRIDPYTLHPIVEQMK